MSDENDSWLAGIGIDVSGILGSVQDSATAVLDDIKSAGAAVYEEAKGAVSAASAAVFDTPPPPKPAAPAPKPAAPAGAPSAKGGSALALKGSVGAGGKNNPDDVKAVQSALKIAADGNCSPATIEAIKTFQKSIGHKKPDGRIDVGGPTARALAGRASAAAPPSAPPPAPNAMPPAERVSVSEDEEEGFFDSLKNKVAEKFDEAASAVQDLGGKIVDEVKNLGGNVLPDGSPGPSSAAANLTIFPPVSISGDVVKSNDGKQSIRDELQDLSGHISDYWNTYHRGLLNFKNFMDSASDAETEPKYLDATFKAVGKVALDGCLDAFSKGVDEASGSTLAGTLVKFCKAAVEAWIAENERVETAGGQVKVRDYIDAIASNIKAQQDRMKKAVDNGRSDIFQKYDMAAEADPGKGKANDKGLISGEPARLIKATKKGVEAFRAKMPDERFFQQEFTRNFANTPGLAGPVAQGGREAGTLYYEEFYLYLENPDAAKPGDHIWEVKEQSSAWVLVTKQKNAERVADSLFKSLNGKKIWQIALEKRVKIRLEIEEEWAINPIEDGVVSFTDNPNNYRISAGGRSDPRFAKLFDEAWNLPMTRNLVLNHSQKLVGKEE